MVDGYGRVIDYARISVTDRCNLRCRYCMPEEGVPALDHGDILRYEDIARLCALLGELGITRFRLTGGEPLVRRGLERLVASLKALPAAERVTLTTNGVLLEEQLPALAAAGLDGVNISLDSLDGERYAAITRRRELERALRGLEAALALPQLNVKVNCVPLSGGEADWVALAGLAKDRPLAVRFIELMPIGLGKTLAPCTEAQVRRAIEGAYGPLTPFGGVLGSGPCRYFTLKGFAGQIGFISAMSRRFCQSCNRVRITSAGFLKPCLQYGAGVDLAPLLPGGDGPLRDAILAAVAAKPAAHQFERGWIEGGEERHMHRIGG